MNFSYVWKFSLVFSITIICVASELDNRGITPWMVSIQKYNLVGDIKGYVYHCAGVLLQPVSPVILMSEECLNTFPANSPMVFFAGGERKHYINDGRDKNIQKLLPKGHMTRENYHTATFFKPTIETTNYIDFLERCYGGECERDPIVYQVGWSDNGVKFIQYNFSNSSQLCVEANESEDKFCAYHNCVLNLNERNSGGEVLTKIKQGITLLMGFWAYDVCDKNIRVFTRLKRIAF